MLLHPVWAFMMFFALVMFFISFIYGSQFLKKLIKNPKSEGIALIGILGGWGVLILVGSERSGLTDTSTHPIWMFVLVFAIVMLFMSLIEVNKWVKYLKDTKSKSFVLVSVLGCWGCLILIALARAGILN